MQFILKMFLKCVYRACNLSLYFPNNGQVNPNYAQFTTLFFVFTLEEIFRVIFKSLRLLCLSQIPLSHLSCHSEKKMLSL